MKKNLFFLTGISVLVLIFTLIFAGCEEEAADSEGVQEVSGVVSNPGISNPVVTDRLVYINATAIGVELKWPYIIDASGYQVWRSGGSSDPERLATIATINNNQLTYTYTDNATAVASLVKGNKYTYTVLATSTANVKDVGKWSKDITIDDPLFGYNAGITLDTFGSSSLPYVLSADSNTVLNYYNTITFNNMKLNPDATYTFERTELNSYNIPIGWAPVNLNRNDPGNNNPLIDNLLLDYFGNLSYKVGNTFYKLDSALDRTLPAKDGKYKYRIKGTKNGRVDYVESGIYTVNLKDYLLQNIKLTIETKVVNGSSDTFKITPVLTITKRDVLQSTDQVAVYYLLGDTLDCYEYGQYTKDNKHVFTKVDLESIIFGVQIADRKIIVPNATTGKYLYAQAWLERANGEKYPLTAANWNTTGAITAAPISNNGQYHVRLTY